MKKNVCILNAVRMFNARAMVASSELPLKAALAIRRTIMDEMDKIYDGYLESGDLVSNYYCADGSMVYMGKESSC